MTALLHVSKPSAPNPVSAAITATLIVVIPIALALICFAAKHHVIELSHTVRAELLFALLLALMASGMPISIALGLSVLTYLFILSDVDPKMVGLKLFTSIDRFEIMAIPFFILAGNFLTAGGVARRMIDFASSLIGHWYGGLGLAGVVACALFAAISGSSVATVVGIGSIILPALMQQGYPSRFSAGVIATSGALGILFPPSINLVIYAVATSGMQPRGPTGAVVDSASIGQLFIAALVPGLILSSMLGATTDAQVDILGEENADSYWRRSDLFDMGLDFTGGRRARAALAQVMVRWITHLLGIDVAIEPLDELRGARLTWYVGLDSEATRIGDRVWHGETLDEATAGRVIALFRLGFLDTALVTDALEREPVYLILAMTPDRIVRMKPQNLLTGLPIRHPEAVG